MLESECVLAQPNVWERRSEEQMAALRMETSDDEPAFNYHSHCLCAHPPLLLSFICPSREEMEQAEGGMLQNQYNDLHVNKLKLAIRHLDISNREVKILALKTCPHSISYRQVGQKHQNFTDILTFISDVHNQNWVPSCALFCFVVVCFL